MDVTALLLSRVQFAFTISFHIIFPSFTIGLAAWLTVLEALHLKTGRAVYRTVFEFWLKIFGVAFGLGVVSGVVMAFQFGTNWSTLAKMSGPIQGPLLSYETFTVFALEASFFGILLFGRPRVPPWFYLFSSAMVSLGTTLSAFWIMVNNSWMQAPIGYVVQNGIFVPDVVYGRSGSSALGDLRRLAYSRRNDTFSNRASGDDLAHRLLHHLYLHFRVRNLLHLPAPAGRSHRTAD